MFEILSDGVFEGEPYWHGLAITTARQHGIISEEEHKELSENTRQKRRIIKNHVRYDTHLKIGEELNQPVLFHVTPDAVLWFAGPEWLQVSAPAFLERLHDQEQSTATAIDVSLRTLSREVLWPAFFREPYKPKYSLILIQSAYTKVYGVWSLHAASAGGQSVQPGEAGELAGQPTEVGELTGPPVLCLLDVMGEAYLRDEVYSRRSRYLDLLCRSRGEKPPDAASPQPTPEQQKAYEGVSKFPMHQPITCHLPLIYQEATKYWHSHLSAEGRSPALLQGVYELTNWALEHAFTAWPLQKQDERIAKLLVREAVRRGYEAVRTTADGEVSSEPFARGLSEAVSELNDSLLASNRITNAQIARFLASVLAVLALRALKASDGERDALCYLACGFRALVLSSDGESEGESLPSQRDLPQEEKFEEWKSSQSSDPLKRLLLDTFEGSLAWFLHRTLSAQGGP
ncbi:MAG: hypothetical protein U0736_12580 [Gemmataceae bacterium]